MPLAEQRRELWNAGPDRGGRVARDRTLGSTPIGPYQLQAAIAAIHDEAPTAEDDRLAADPRALRGPGARLAGARRHVEPRGGGRDGPRTASGSRPPRDPRGRRPHDPHASARRRPRPSPRAGRRCRRRSRRVPTSGDADRERARAPLPHAAGGASRTRRLAEPERGVSARASCDPYHLRQRASCAVLLEAPEDRTSGGSE